MRCWVPKKSGKGENRAAQSSKFNYTSLYQCQLNTCLHLPHLFRRSEFFHDFDAGSTCSTSWYKFLPYVLMWRCPYLKCWFNLTKSRQQLPIPKFFFSSSATSISFFPHPTTQKIWKLQNQLQNCQKTWGCSHTTHLNLERWHTGFLLTKNKSNSKLSLMSWNHSKKAQCATSFFKQTFHFSKLTQKESKYGNPIFSLSLEKNFSMHV